MKIEVPETVQDREGYLDLVELDSHGESLTEWEVDFVESLMKQLVDGRKLTEKQRDKLDAIRDDRLG